MKIFGWEINRPIEDSGGGETRHTKQTFVPPQYDDGALTIQSGSHFGSYQLDMEGVVRNEVELITRYREMAIQPEMDDAINDIVNEAVIKDKKGKSVELRMDELDVSDKLKKTIQEEFEGVLRLLNFSDLGLDVFRTWYIDGRLFYHAIIDEKNPQLGIQELRYIDPRKIRKIREIVKGRDKQTGMETIKKEVQYYLYNERGLTGAPGTIAQYSNLGHRITVDAIVNVNSGLLDAKRNQVISYLHKAIKPLNQLRMVEDATVIYRLSRAPERRIFYIDVGSMQTTKAEQYMKDIMTKYRNKLVYDSSTGEIRDDRRHLAMLEDFWLPRREGGRGTEIDTLQGGQNLGEIEDVVYFEQKLYKALNIPYSRTQPDQGFNLGRSTEITRDELKFNKFIDKLRSKFSTLLDELLKRQLILKRVMTEEEWFDYREYIFFSWLEDNNFTELKNAELNRERLSMLQLVDPYVGRYYSLQWVYENALNMADDEMEEMMQQMKSERDSGMYEELGIGMDAMMAGQEEVPPDDSGGSDSSGGGSKSSSSSSSSKKSDGHDKMPKMPKGTALINTEENDRSCARKIMPLSEWSENL